MTKNTRRRFSGKEKVAILKRHLVNHEAISDICDELSIHPTMLYKWQKTFFENGASAFESSTKPVTTKQDEKMTKLKDQLTVKNDVISELVTELIMSKKNNGDI